MFIKNNAYVGINNVTPSYTLDVTGDMRATEPSGYSQLLHGGRRGLSAGSKNHFKRRLPNESPGRPDGAQQGSEMSPKS